MYMSLVSDASFLAENHQKAFDPTRWGSLQRSPSFPEKFRMYSDACEVTSSLLDTLIDHLTYLLLR